MDIQVIHHEDPRGLGIGGDGVLDVSGEVRLSAPVTDGRREHVASGHLKVADQALGTVTFVVLFAPLDESGASFFGRRTALQRLNAAHLIGAHHMSVLLQQRGRLMVELTDSPHLLTKQLWVSRITVLPAPAAMRFEIQLVLKNGPFGGPRCF